MDRARRVKVVCSTMMLLYLAVAAGRLVAAALPLIDPALSTASIYCASDGCELKSSPDKLLSAAEHRAQPLSPARRSQLEARIREPDMKAKLFMAELVRSLPATLLFLSLALASRALAGGGLTLAIRWLRRAATAALVAVIAQPFADSIRATALSWFMTGRDQLFVTFQGGPFLWGVLLAGAVWMSVWALEQARLTEAELAEIV